MFDSPLVATSCFEGPKLFGDKIGCTSKFETANQLFVLYYLVQHIFSTYPRFPILVRTKNPPILIIRLMFLPRMNLLKYVVITQSIPARRTTLKNLNDSWKKPQRGCKIIGLASKRKVKDVSNTSVL